MTLTLLLALGLCTAPAETTALTVWHSFRGGEEAVLRELVEQYQRDHLSTTVTLTEVPFDNLQNKLLQALLSHEPPDLFFAPHERLLNWARYLAPLEPIGALPASEQAVTLDGTTFGFPYSLKTLVLIRRRDLLPAPVIDIAELEAGIGSARGLGFDTSSFYFLSPFYLAATPTLFTADDTLTVTEPGALATFGWLRAATMKPRFLGRGLDHAQLVSEFRAGHIAALIDGPWVLSDLASLEQIATQVLPVFRPLEQPLALRPFLTVDALFVPKEGHPLQATELGRYLASPSHCEQRVSRGRQLPPFASCAARLRGEDERLLGPFFAEAALAVPMPVTTAMGAAWNPLGNLMSTVVNTKRPIAAAAEQTQAELARLLLPDRASPFWLDGLLMVGIGGVAVALLRRRRRVLVSEKPLAAVLAFVLPAALFALPLLFMPLLVGVGLSFFSHQAGHFAFVGIGNYLSLLTHPSFYLTLGVTVLWTVLNLACHLVLGISLALALNRPGLKGRGVFRALLIVPWALPNYISALVWKNLFNYQLGAINQALKTLGVGAVDWFASFAGALTADVVTNAWLGFPFVMVVTLGALQAIPESLKEAMLLDGANARQRFVHLTLPTVAPVMAPALVLSAIWTFNMFNVIYLVSGGEPRGQTDILISEAYRWAFERGARYGYAAAYCVAIFAVLAALLALKNRLSPEAQP